jgi:hypothetical protein
MFGQQQVNRFPPNLPAWAYRTYALDAPLETHFRAATCAEVDCEAQSGGWCSLIDETTDLGQRQAHYIRKLSGRAFTESRSPEGLTVFDFPAGQTCFRQHRVHLEREPHYLVRGGDFRGDPRGEGVRVHKHADDWVDQFASNLDEVKTAKERG